MNARLTTAILCTLTAALASWPAQALDGRNAVDRFAETLGQWGFSFGWSNGRQTDDASRIQLDETFVGARAFDLEWRTGTADFESVSEQEGRYRIEMVRFPKIEESRNFGPLALRNLALEHVSYPKANDAEESREPFLEKISIESVTDPARSALQRILWIGGIGLEFFPDENPGYDGFYGEVGGIRADYTYLDDIAPNLWNTAHARSAVDARLTLRGGYERAPDGMALIDSVRLTVVDPVGKEQEDLLSIDLSFRMSGFTADTANHLSDTLPPAMAQLLPANTAPLFNLLSRVEIEEIGLSLDCPKRKCLDAVLSETALDAIGTFLRLGDGEKARDALAGRYGRVQFRWTPREGSDPLTGFMLLGALTTRNLDLLDPVGELKVSFIERSEPGIPPALAGSAPIPAVPGGG